MSYLLLRNKQFCPACHFRTHPSHFSGCKNCGVMLFLRPINFTAYEDDGNLRIYWLWTSAHGWIHRDHVIGGFQAQSREVKIEEPDSNYGRHTTPEEVAARGGKFTRKTKSVLP